MKRLVAIIFGLLASAGSVAAAKPLFEERSGLWSVIGIPEDGLCIADREALFASTGIVKRANRGRITIELKHVRAPRDPSIPNPAKQRQHEEFQRLDLLNYPMLTLRAAHFNGRAQPWLLGVSVDGEQIGEVTAELGGGKVRVNLLRFKDILTEINDLPNYSHVEFELSLGLGAVAFTRQDLLNLNNTLSKCMKEVAQ